ncbi:xanthine dehydrogenase subunit D [Paenibacillus xanthanilyticus]|uniref:Xanthine dehydrogenase subunit D n=1 Tax=Paenibacillus xanthanilyticus TaxID=1783531 RepID=A0ABV8K766_9BACL
MALNRETSGGRWRIRPDGPAKVTGTLTYLTDMSMPGMLYGRVLRSPHPYAGIRMIDTSKAEALEGVHAVLTWRDVPGLNGYGIAVQDQPVLCRDYVRYVGDAVATVAADTPELADYALSLIQVDYEVLAPIVDPEAALEDDAPKLHPHGNVLHRAGHEQGNIAEGFEQCVHVVEATYLTPRQMHAYMETEGGLFVPEPDGRLTVYAPTQHGLMDRLQLSRILDRPQTDIRIVSSPIGGSFGGKDELNIQPYGALLALCTGRPVKIHNSRWESVRAGLKRHPMTIKMKTGIDADGRIKAHDVSIIADTGPYATLGAEVLNFAVEHVIGPYRYEHLQVSSVSVHTNNGMSGEFRGFGGNQAIFALEGQMDRLARKAGIDPWEFRRLNMRRADDPGPFGHPIARTNGAEQVWRTLAESDLYARRGYLEDAAEAPLSPPWIRKGIGAAFVMHGAGLGFGIPDPAGGRLRLAGDGKIEALFGYEEFGQGLIATLELMLIEEFGFAPDDFRIVIGDTDRVPDSGSTTASRATSMMWQSLQRLRDPFRSALLKAAAALLDRPAEELAIGEAGVREKGGERSLLLAYQDLAAGSGEEIAVETNFIFPASDTKRIGAHLLYTYAAVAVEAEVNTLTGRVRVTDQFHAVAAGPVMNPQGYLGQIEGGSSMALGYALTEEAVMSEGEYVTKNFDTYLIPTIEDSRGRFEVVPIEELPEGDPHGPRGVGEIGSVGLAPAIAEAVFQALGTRITRLPIDPEELQKPANALRKAAKAHD